MKLHFQAFLTKLSVTIMLLASLGLSACAPTRKPVPPGEIPQAKPPSVTEEQYGHEILSALSERYKLDYNNPRSQEVQNVVDRLTAAAHADQNPWHVYILQDAKLKNAAATRGNHVFIWSAMLDYAKSEDELATILAHEISHVLAGHTDPDPNEELKKMMIQIGALAAGMAVSMVTKSPTYSADLGRITSGLTQEVGNSFLVYPFSRGNELEADQVGLFLMAEAKYDPRKAVEFWKRIGNDPSFSSGPGFLSTHPPAKDRIEQLERLLPAALARYEGKPVPPGAIASTGTASNNVLTAPPDANVANPVLAANPAPQTASSGQATTTDARNDSFDLSSPTPIVLPDRPSPSLTADDTGPEWEVIAAKSYLYVSPRAKSKKIGEFSRGARLTVLSENRGWLEVAGPDHGFIRREDAARSR